MLNMFGLSLNTILQFGVHISKKTSSSLSLSKNVLLVMFFFHCHLPFNSYEDCLTKLGIKSLEYRRLEFDLILMYKISHNLCDLNFSDYFIL